jgi:hypothetical protein
LREGFGSEFSSVKLYQDVIFHMGNCHYRLKEYSRAVEYYNRRF